MVKNTRWLVAGVKLAEAHRSALRVRREPESCTTATTLKPTPNTDGVLSAMTQRIHDFGEGGVYSPTVVATISTSGSHSQRAWGPLKSE